MNILRVIAQDTAAATPEPAAESVIVALPDASTAAYERRAAAVYLLPPAVQPAPPRLRDIAVAGNQKYEHWALLLLGAAGLAGIILAFAVF